MKSCVTISLVPEARGGPFVFWDDLRGSAGIAAELGFEAIEIFPSSPVAVDARELREILTANRLTLAAVGTGAGWVKHKLSLTSADPEVRKRARDFIAEMINFAAPFGAAVIIGSMQGKIEGTVSRAEALELLKEALNDLAEKPSARDTTILYEHLNRYETNVLNRIEDVVPFLAGLPGNVKILADLFHMSIEESSIADALRAAGPRLGHVHLADSNRRPAGLGHTDFGPIFQVLRDLRYDGYVSAEALPYPDSKSAAEQTLRVFNAQIQLPI
jgi:sugar phosphate isomerase/epimerase